jgi:hypothetical protein
MKLIKNQRGAVDIILILVVLVLAAGVGGYVYYRQQQNNKVYSNSGSGVTVSKNAVKKPTTSAATITKYLTIPELGVKFALSADISDAYYTIDKEPGTGKPVYDLRVHSLDSESDCTTGVASIAALDEAPKTTPLPDGRPITAVYKGYISGTNFYYITLAQYSCVQNSQNQAKLDAVRNAFEAASATIQASK